MTLVPGSLRVPPDTVQRMRAKLIHDLTALRAQAAEARDRPPPRPRGRRRYCRRSSSTAWRRSPRSSSPPELAELAPDWLYLPLTEMNEAADTVELFIKKGVRVAAVLPRVIQDAELGELAGAFAAGRAPSASPRRSSGT